METTSGVFNADLGLTSISSQSAKFGFLDDDLVISFFYATYY